MGVYIIIYLISRPKAMLSFDIISSPAAPAGGARRQSGREKNSPRRSCSSAGPQNLSYGSGEVGGNIQVCPFRTQEGSPKLTRSFFNCRRGTFRNAYLTQIIVETIFKVCMCVGAPETENNTQNPRESVVFDNMSPLNTSVQRIQIDPSIMVSGAYSFPAFPRGR